MKVLKNSVYTVGGEAGAAILNFVMLAILARWLGPEDFGQIVLAMTYALTFDLLLNFQSWRLLIRYGARAVKDDNQGQLASIIKVSACMDIGTAIIATVCCFILAGTLMPYFNGSDIDIFHIFSLTVLFNIVGHSTGLLRLFERFIFLSAHRIFTSIVRLFAVMALISVGMLSLVNVAWALVISEGVMRGVLVIAGLVEASRQGVGNFYRAPVMYLIEDFDDLLSFSVFSNLNDAVLKVFQQIDVLLVAYFLMPSEAGGFRLIKSIGSICTMVSGALGQVIYPEIARIYSENTRHLNRFLGKLWMILAFVASIGFLGYWLLGDKIIEYVFGQEYSAIFFPSVVYVFGAAVGIMLLPFTPLLLVRGQQRLLFIAYLIASIAYILSVVIGVKFWGLVGASGAFLVLYMFYFFVLMYFKVLRERS